MSITVTHYLRDGSFEVRREDPPDPGRNEALVAVEAAGICGTDLHITRVPSTYAWDTEVLGHEFCGRVTAGPPELVGRRAVVDPAIMCGACEPCRRGLRTQCLNFEAVGITRPGGFADVAAVPADRLLPVSDEITPRTAALAEPLACVLYALRRLPPLEPGGRAVVLGAGPIGALFAAVLERAMGRRVVVSEPSEPRRAHLAPRLDAELVEPAALDPSFQPELVVDTTGFLFADAVELARPGGVILCFGLEERGGQSAQVRFAQKELTAVSSFAAWGTFATAIDLLERGVVTADDLVTGIFPLEEVKDAFDVARSGSGLKVLLEPAA
jgi:threonine dehydrogenase-like Zn-dependent dehydrogenase